MLMSCICIKRQDEQKKMPFQLFKTKLPSDHRVGFDGLDSDTVTAAVLLAVDS